MTSGERHAPEPVGPFVVGAHEQHPGVSGATFWQTFQRGQEARLVFFLNRVVKRHHQHCCCKVGVFGGGERRFKNFGELTLPIVYSSVDLVHLALLGVATRSLSAGRQRSVRSVLRGALAGTLPLSQTLLWRERDSNCQSSKGGVFVPNRLFARCWRQNHVGPHDAEALSISVVLTVEQTAGAYND